MKIIIQAFITRKVKQHFGFLFERGYKIQNFQYHSRDFGNWGITLKSKNNLIIVSCDREEILLSFAPLNTNGRDGIGIEPLVYFLSQGQKFIGGFEGSLFWEKSKQFERLANLLKVYLDEITPYFGDEFPKYRAELLSAQMLYNEKFVGWRATR